MPAYECRLCGGDAFKGIERDADGKIKPILYPDEILRPELHPQAVMYGVDAQLRPKSSSQFVCKACNETRLTPNALAPLRGRCHNYHNPHEEARRKKEAAEAAGWGDSCSMM